METDSAIAVEPDPVLEIHAPETQLLPVVLASPHSGRRYSELFLAASKLDPLTLRRSEDGFVDEIFGGGPDQGVPLLCALFPRAFLDTNREAFELDPEMFADSLPSYVNSRSTRVAAGLGTIAKVVARGHEIYRDKLSFDEALYRVETLYRPYHCALGRLIDATIGRFGYCILIDCHSMPSNCEETPIAECGHRRSADFVLGDCHGHACHSAVTNTAIAWLSAQGYHVRRNAPYAGGYTTRHYGRPRAGIHALQIEINRGLYMDEGTLTRKPFLATLASQMTMLTAAIGRIDAGVLLPRQRLACLANARFGLP